jgi:hypothetical protein
MRAQFVNENIKFERGQEPRKSMGIGLTIPDKIVQAIKEVAKSRPFADEVEVYDEDPNTFTAGFHYRNATLSISIEPDYEKNDQGFIYSSGMEDDGFPSSEYNEYDTLEEAKERMDDWCDIIDENIEEQGNHCPECGGELEGDWCDNCDGEDYEEDEDEEEDEDINESVKFERGQDPMKGLDVGRDRKMPKEELKKAIIGKIWPRISGDAYFVGKVSGKHELWEELENWTDVIIDSFQIERPSELGYPHFKEYWGDIFNE